LLSLLFDRRLQLSVTTLMILVAVLVYLVLGRLYLASTEEETRMLTTLQGTQLLLAGDDPDQAAYLAEAAKYLHDEGGTRVVTMFSILVVLIGVLFGAGVYLTHRISGPVYAVSKHLGELAAGRWRPMHAFRPGDQFTFLKDQVDAVVARVHADARADLELLTALKADPGLSPELRERLTAATERKNAALGDGSVQA
jgi:hypothetical protein